MMLFAFFAFFIALASASPTPLVGNVDAAQSINDCDYGTYEDHTNADSALIADCLVLADNISGDGTWTIGNNEFRQLAQYKSCAFSVVDDRCADPPESDSLSCTFLNRLIHIGNEDIRGAIHNAIENSKKMWNPAAVGKVGAKGVFNCETSLVGQTEAVRWSITRNTLPGTLALTTDPVGNATDPVGNIDAARTINDCDYGTYQDDTHNFKHSALIADCMTLADNIFGDGTWTFPDNSDSRQLAHYKTCAFNVVSDRCAGSTTGLCGGWQHLIHIGNEDIRGVIHNAVDNAKKLAKPGTEGKVGAKGVFNCQTDLIGKWEAVRWSINWNPFLT